MPSLLGPLDTTHFLLPVHFHLFGELQGAPLSRRRFASPQLAFAVPALAGLAVGVGDQHEQVDEAPDEAGGQDHLAGVAPAAKQGGEDHDGGTRNGLRGKSTSRSPTHDALGTLFGGKRDLRRCGTL